MNIRSYLDNLSSDLVLSQNEKNNIRNSIDYLENNIDYFFSLIVDNYKIIGSYTRKTILPRVVDENSDIDFMIIFNNDSKYKPGTFINKLKKFAEKYYSTSEIYQDHPTVVLELNHIKFELIPAYKDLFKQIYIPAPNSDYREWMKTDPVRIKDKIDDANKRNDYKIKPVIRLIKYWNANNDYVYNSYELEKDILDINFILCSNIKDYFYKTVDRLKTYSLPDYKKNKVNKLKDKTKKIKDSEDEYPYKALSDIKKVLPKIN